MNIPGRHRKYRFKKEKRRNRIILLAVLILIIVLIIAGCRAMHSDAYHSQHSFERFVKKYYEGFENDTKAHDEAASAKYGEPLSKAVNLAALPKRFNKDDYSKAVSDDEKTFDSKYSSLDKKNARAAFLVGSEQTKSPYKTRSIAVHEKQYVKKDKTESTPVDKVMTCNFIERSGIELSNTQVFNAGFVTALAVKVNDALGEKYDSDDINLKKVSSKESNFSNYILTRNGIRFYFDAGQAADKTAGVLSADVAYKDLKKIIRKDLGKRTIDPDKPMVAITYDDGPHEKYTSKILDVYEKYGQTATFFEVGKNIKEVPDSKKLLKRELDLGCEVGTHSWRHANLLTLSGKQLQADAQKAKKAVRDCTGEDPTILRAPYGNTSKKIVKAYGLSEVNWSVDSLDWKLRNTNKIYRRIRCTKDFNGQIVLMHSIYSTSAKATEKLVPYLVKKGYQLVTVHELLQYKYHDDPKAVKNYGYNFIK